MRYDRRDQIGHYVTKKEPVYRPCHHACCRGYRPHPSNWPIIPAKMAYRTATDEQLQRHYERAAGVEDDPKARRAELQILNEFERRDRAEMRRRQKEQERARHREAVAANRAIRRTEQDVELERMRVAAEASTQGYLVNAKGRARGIQDIEVLTGRRAVFDRYATQEAKDYFEANPRPTAAYFRGRDTRAHAQATEPRRRQRGVKDRVGRVMYGKRAG